MRNGRLSKDIGLTSLIMSGMTCMIGSGWLFGAYKATKIAGPAALVSWIIGGIAILFIALTYAELSALFPRVGGMVRYLEYTHGSFAGFTAGWANWLAIVTVIPVESTASVQYMASWPWAWAQALYNMQNQELSPWGLFAASLLLIFYFLMNYWSVKLFLRFMVSMALIKIFVPLLTFASLFFASFHPNNFHFPGQGFAPFGITGILTAVSTSGIVFAFHGFQSIINLAGETKRPGKNIPIAIISAIFSTLIIYLLLQATFISAMPTHLVQLGWDQIRFDSPFAELAIAFNLNFLVLSLYFDAFISPSGTASTYMATTSRMLYGMTQNGYMPKFMGILNPTYHIARGALWINLIISFIFLWVFKGWSYLVPIVSLMGVISYMAGPISTVALRHLGSHFHRPIKIPFLNILAPMSFIIISLILYWGRWPLTGEVILLVLAGYIIYAYYQYKKSWSNLKKQFKSGVWILFYLLTIALLSFIGSNKFGGINLLNYSWSMIFIVISSLAYYYWGIKTAWETPFIKKMTRHERLFYSRKK